MEQQADPPPEEPPLPSPVLRRSTEDRMIAGVAGGLGRYLGIDPVLVRIVFLVLAFFGGSGILLYVIGWIAMPLERPGDPVGAGKVSGDTTRLLIGTLLVVVGSVWLLERLVPRFGAFVGPAVLIALGLGLLLGTRR